MRWKEEIIPIPAIALGKLLILIYSQTQGQGQECAKPALEIILPFFMNQPFICKELPVAALLNLACPFFHFLRFNLNNHLFPLPAFEHSHLLSKWSIPKRWQRRPDPDCHFCDEKCVKTLQRQLFNFSILTPTNISRVFRIN